MLSCWRATTVCSWLTSLCYKTLSPSSLNKSCLLASDKKRKKKSSINIHLNFHFTFNFMSHNQPHSWQSHHRLIMLEQLLHMKLFKDARWAGLTCGGLYPELEPACSSDRQLHGALLYRPDTRLCLIWWGLTSSCLLPGSVSGGVETILPPQIFTPSLRPSHLDALNINGKSEDSG